MIKKKILTNVCSCHTMAWCVKNAGILFQFPHLFPYFNGCRRSSVTIGWLQKVFCNHRNLHNVGGDQIFDGCRRSSATIENLHNGHNGYRKTSATVKIRKQMRKLKQNTSVFGARWHVFSVSRSDISTAKQCVSVF